MTSTGSGSSRGRGFTQAKSRAYGEMRSRTSGQSEALKTDYEERPTQLKSLEEHTHFRFVCLARISGETLAFRTKNPMLLPIAHVPAIGGNRVLVPGLRSLRTSRDRSPLERNASGHSSPC